MTEDELVAIEARANTATPGPWTRIINTCGGPVIYSVWVEDARGWSICVDVSEADAEFIAAARDAVPALIAEVRRLQEELLTAIERTQGSVHDYYYDKIRDMTIEIEQLHDQIGRDAISYAQCDSDRRNFAARCAWMREELMDRGVTQKELDEHE